MEALALITEEDFRRAASKKPRSKREFIQVAYPRFMYSTQDILRRNRAISTDVSCSIDI
jgi:hypothetical protein